MATIHLLPRPLPFLDQPFQSGIADPRFPLLPPVELENDEDYNLYKGLVDRQNYISIIKSNVLTNDKSELEILLRLLSKYALEAMEQKPSHKHLMPLEAGRIPESWRVTVTIAFGYSLFIDKAGNDRFGLNFNKPKYLKPIPTFPGDEFKPLDSMSDLLLLVSSDHPYINVAITRYFAEYINRDFKKESNTARKVFQVEHIEQGFGRPDRREFLKFDDGIDNLRANIDLEKLVFVDDTCQEPDWCLGGSYLVYKKIREMMPVWEAFATKHQEEIIGREKETGKPLSRKTEGINNLTPVYPDPKSSADGPLNAHVRKVQPRRPFPDLFGMNDLDRRFLRRPYPFFDGVDEVGNSINGLLFLAFMKSIQQQFEHVTNMWQMNPDFPVEGTGVDSLFAKEVLKCLDGGYYFCPPAPASESEFVGSGLFKKPEQKNYKIPKYIYGYGITFVDIDETIFHTYAEVNVMKGGLVVRKLNNQEFNDYKLGDGETFDFGEFKNSDVFLNTSKPIVSVVKELKKILNIITSNSEGSRIVFLTARSDFDDKEKFLNTFRKYGIDIDSSRMYVERSGNISNGTVAEKKKEVVLKYLSEGTYRRVRLLDDDINNLNVFMTIKAGLPSSLIQLIRDKHFLTEDIDPIEFFAYQINKDGEMTLIDKK